MRGAADAAGRALRGAASSAAFAVAAVGCAAPVTLTGTVDRPAVRNLWLSFDDRWLLIRTDRQYVLADLSLLSTAVLGEAGGPDTDVWASPLSHHFVEVDAAGRRARMLFDLRSTPMPGVAWLTHRGLDDWVQRDMPAPHEPQGTWSAWFALAESPPPAVEAPPGTPPSIPAAGDVLPAEPLAFWTRFAAGRTVKDDDSDRTPTAAEVKAALEGYARSRADFRLVPWSSPRRPAAPAELDGPSKRRRIHLRPNWGVFGYGVDVVREDLRTGKKNYLIRSGG
jgi:hypothetical protein